MSCPWAQYWEQLKDQDRFKSAAAAFASLQKKAATAQARAAARAAAAAASGDGGPAAEQAAAGADPAPAAAANAAAARNDEGNTAATDKDDSDEDEQGPPAGRPIGCMAAKRARADSIADDRTIGLVASAVERLGDATTQRTAMMAFILPFMRTTPEGAAFCAHQARKMLAKEGIKVKTPEKAGDASAAVEGDAQETRKDKFVAPPPPLGDVGDLSAIDGVSATGNAAAEADVTVVADTRSSVSPPEAPPALVEETADASTRPTPAAAPAATAAAATAAAGSVPTLAAASSTPTSGAAPAAKVPSSSPAPSTANKQRGRRALATKRKQAALSMNKQMQTTVDLTSPPPAAPAASAARAAQSSLAAAAAAAAAAVAASNDARRTPPPPGSSSDESLSDGGGFDGFDSDLIAAFERNGGRSSSESEHDE